MSIFALRTEVQVELGVEQFCAVCDVDVTGPETFQACSRGNCPCEASKTDPTDVVHLRNPVARDSLEWIRRGEEIGKAVRDGGGISLEQLQFMQEVLSANIVRVNGETVNWSADELDQRVSPTMTYAVFVAYLAQVHLPSDTRGKSKRRQKSASRRTRRDTTAAAAPTKSNGSSAVPTPSPNLAEVTPEGTA